MTHTEPRGPSRDRLQHLIRQSAALQVRSEGETAPGALRPEALDRLLEISRTMNALTERDALLVYIRDCLRELFDAENCRVVLVRDDGEIEPLSGSEDEVSHSLIDRVVRERRAVLIQDATQDPDLRDKSSVVRLGLVSVLCAPLVVRGEVTGVIQFDHRNRPGPFTQEDLVLLEMFARQAATALANMSLVERLQEALVAKHEAESRLIEGERLRALGEMAAAMAHDFNNFLTSIIGLGDLVLCTPDLPPESRNDLETLQTTALSAAATVRRLQEFAGGSSSSEEPDVLDVAAIVDEAASMCRARAGDSSVVRITLETSPTPGVLGRCSELRDVVINLMINGLEAMPDGGELTVRTRGVGRDVLVEVEDSGQGIDEEVRLRIFEPFFSTKDTGTGLGLSICWGITRRMGGEIAVDGAPGGGSRFTVRLPAHELPPTERKKDAPHEAAPSMRILVVDDNRQVLNVLCRLIQELGHTAVSALGGRSALEQLDESFDLVLTDVDMPGVDGLEVQREVARRRADVPVILMTGWNSGGREGDALLEGSATTLQKPITIDALAEALRTAVRS